MDNQWKANLGSLWRGFKVNGKRAAPLVGTGVISRSEEGKFELSAKYDPPGSWWMAIGAGLVTAFFVTAMAQALGAFIGPGWGLWYVIIVLVRRRNISVQLAESESAVIDNASRRIGFFTEFEGRKHWAAFEAREDFDGLIEALKAIDSFTVSEGKIGRRLKAFSIILLIFLVLIFVSIFAAFLFMARRMPEGPAMR